MAGGAKLRVTGESVKPVMSVDDEGYWTISYDGWQDLRADSRCQRLIPFPP